MSEHFADGWITRGWSLVDGKWVEIGEVPGVEIGGVTATPDLTIHEVADKLNQISGSRGINALP